MALMMTLMPIGNVLPEVSVYAAVPITLQIEKNDYISDIVLKKDGVEVTGKTIEGDYYKWLISEAASYTLDPEYVENSPYELSASCKTVAITSEDLTDTALSTKTHTLELVTKEDKSFSVKFTDSNGNELTPPPTVTKVVVGSGTEQTSDFKVPAVTSKDAEIKVTYSFTPAFNITSGSSDLSYDTTNKKYTAVFSIKVEDLLKQYNPGVIDIKMASNFSKTITATRATVVIPTEWKAAENKFYLPLDASTSYNLTFEPASSMVAENSILTINSTPYSFTAGKVEYTVNHTTSDLDVKCSEMPVPNGTFKESDGTEMIADTYFKKENQNITYTINNPSYDWQYKVVDANESVPATGWTNVAKIYNSVIISVPYEAGKNKMIYVRYYEDGGWNSTSQVSNVIMFDETAPTEVEKKLLIGSNEYSIDTTERWVNANSGNVSIRIEANDTGLGLDKITYTYKDALDTVIGSANISENFDDGMVTIPVNNRACKKIEYTISDKAGNTTVTSTIDLTNIKFDLLAPTFDVDYYVVDGTPTGTAIQESELANWQTKSIKVIVTPTEATAPAGETESGLATNPVAVTYEDGTPISVTSNGGMYEFTLSDSKEHKFKIAVSDNAGNIFVSDIKTVKIDTVGLSGIKLTVGGWDTPTAFYGNVEVKVSVDQSVSGLKKVDFIFHDNASGYEAIKTIDAASNVATCAFPIEEFSNGFDGYVKAVCYDDTGVSIFPHVQNKDISPIQYSKNAAIITLNANQEWTNQNVPVSFVVENQKTSIAKIIYYVDGVEKETITAFEDPHKYSFTFDVDKVSSSPAGTEVVVKVINNAGLETRNNIYVFIDKQAPTVTLGGVTEGATYNSARSLQITTNDNIWQKLQPVSVTATRTIDGNTTDIDLGSYTVDSANHVMSKAFSEDGIYNVTVKAVDAAGNTDTKTISFTIDRTAPVISMTGVKEGAYSSNPVTVTFQSVESFFDTNNVKITVERKIEGSTYERTLTFNNTGKTSNLANTFTEDGDYTITMTAVDRAGNEATPQTLSFTVDCTAPSVTLTGTKDYFVTNQPVTLDFLVKEAYFETNQVQIRGSRRLANGKTEAINISGWSNTGISSSLSNEFTEDGYYTITISATDKAGNNKQQTIHFTIDTEAPVIGDLSQYDGKYLSSFELKESLEDLISELSVPTVKMTLNGEAYDGHEITEDGKYTLVIEVVDEVGLSSTKSVEFVIDKTAPKIIFAGVEDKKTYTEAVRLNLSLENENDTIVEILINGEPYELTEGQSSYDISFDTFGDYEVVVLTIDEAGNDNRKTIQFTYAEHKNMAFLWIVIGAVVVAAGLVIFLVVKSKKKQ